jgi:hypothetical protein
VITYQFLQTVALWCTLSASGGYITTIEHCRQQALQCAASAVAERDRAECIAKIAVEIR